MSMNSIIGNKPRVLVAMSGGVDSSVAAFLLLRAGYECTGALMKLYEAEEGGLRGDADRSGSRGDSAPAVRLTSSAESPLLPDLLALPSRLSAAVDSFSASQLSTSLDSSSASQLSTSLDSSSASQLSTSLDSSPALLASHRGCCTLEDAEDARAVAQRLDMPFYVFNFTREFEERVLARFVWSYQGGITPNPCIDCNRFVKFEKFLHRALETEHDFIATGHYARIEKTAGGRYLLKKGIDETKDQSYVLYAMTQQQLACTLFPLGDLTKAEVRALAESVGLANAKKRDSQDICFAPDGDYAGFIERYKKSAAPPCSTSGKITEVGCHFLQHKQNAASACSETDAAFYCPKTNAPNLPHFPLEESLLEKSLRAVSPSPSPINGCFVGTDGRILGRHRGLIHYTIGQRKGLGISAPHPLYVQTLDVENNAIILCESEELFSPTLTAYDINLIPFETLPAPLRVTAKIRYSHIPQPATVHQTGNDTLHITFDTPQRAITPGQAVVLYDGDIVIGGGTVGKPDSTS